MVDSNVGRLGRALRMMGYDTLFTSNNVDDDTLVDMALRQQRVVLTRDTHIMERRVVAQGQLRAMLIQDDNWRQQLTQVVMAFKLDWRSRQFSRCIECNTPLDSVAREQVKDMVPAYVYKTQTHYKQCPQCHRVYWQGSHWRHMREELERLLEPGATQPAATVSPDTPGPEGGAV